MDVLYSNASALKYNNFQYGYQNLWRSVSQYLCFYMGMCTEKLNFGNYLSGYSWKICIASSNSMKLEISIWNQMVKKWQYWKDSLKIFCISYWNQRQPVQTTFTYINWGRTFSKVLKWLFIYKMFQIICFNISRPPILLVKKVTSFGVWNN